MKTHAHKELGFSTLARTILAAGFVSALTGCSTGFQKTGLAMIPVPEIEDAWHGTHVERTVINVPRKELRAWMDKTELSDILPGSREFPSVVGTQMLTSGGWGQPGARRKVDLSDGTWVVEEVLVARPERFEYVVWNFSASTRHLIKYANGRFDYEDLGDGTTAVTWTYRFRPRAAIFNPFVKNFAEKRFSTFMASGLQTIKEKGEAAWKEKNRG